MRILMFGWEFPPHISGGLGTACLGLTRAMSELGQAVTYVIPRARTGAEPGHVRLVSAAEVPAGARPGQDAEDAASPAGAPGKPLEILLRTIDSPLHPYLREDRYPGAPAGAAGMLAPSGNYGPDLMAEVLRYGKAAGRIAAEASFDVIHAHDWMTVPAALEARRVSGRPFVYHVHATEIDRSGNSVHPAIFEVERLGMSLADRVIAVSHYTRSLIVRHYGIPAGKISVVHNAVTRREAGPAYRAFKPPGKQWVLFMGRITFQKGPDHFVAAAAKVLAVLPDVRFVMVGAGDLLPQTIERVAELGIGRQVHFTGFLDGQEVERMFALSDLYVMPSVSEPFGITPLEAMLHDVPVIISKQSGVGEVLKHVPRVDFWDVDALAWTIVALLKQPELAEAVVARSRGELEALRWETAALRVLDVYRGLLGP